MGRIIGDEPCPECRKRGRDKTGNHLMVFEDGGKYCSRCHYKEDADGVPTEIQGDSMEFDQITALTAATWPARKLKEATLRHFGCKVEYSETSGQIKEVYRPIEQKGKTIAYKAKGLEGGKPYSIGESIKNKKIDLFGQRQCNYFKRLYICEGEEDAMAIWQTMSEKYGQPSVVALRGSHIKALEDNLPFLEKFEELVLCFDMDEAGAKGEAKAYELLGPQKVWHISENDANDMLLHDKKKELINALYSAKIKTPEGFITVDDVFEEATKMPEWGRSWPWPTLTRLTYGRRDGEGMYWGAGVKVGKSEAVNQIIHHITQVEKGKVAVFKFEEKPAMTVRKIAGKIKGKQFHVPDGNFTQKELIEGVQTVKDSGVVMYDAYMGTGWDRIKAAIRHAVVVEGCKDIILDPLTRLTPGMESAQVNTELERISDELSSMAKDLGFFYMIFCHLKAPHNGKPHEEGGRVKSNQYAGSRAMMRACYYMVGIERDKTAEDEEERNTSYFVLLEDRAFGNGGRFPVFYNRETGSYLEPDPNMETY